MKKQKKRKRIARAKQDELAITGVGVEVTTDKKLIDLGDAYLDEKEDKAASMKRLKELDSEILTRMSILNLIDS